MILSAALSGLVVAAATPAPAQTVSAPASYLSWAGKPTTAVGQPTYTAAPTLGAASAPRIIPHGGFSEAPAPMPVRTATSTLAPAAPTAARIAPDAAPPPAPATAASPSGARYYSVHRQYGRQPDAMPTPAPVYLDALPLELERTPETADLAQPPEAPTLLRDVNGRIRPAVPTVGDEPS
ncbi:MAG: hypothetical protein KF910_06210 [Brevundimonas sp.]|uniref:hypothetical protein n=1 Tax=Brevundimonas sp. TaxID=1871086 RepID=UPI0025C625A1|nr:hypothetical protein [Brevundimonas sp.]MBX3477179.1 hypothetical protein [Brevundimonas sp.]